MQTAKLKKTTTFRLTNSRIRLLLCKIIATIGLLSNFNYSVIAQSNTVYGIEALKINTGDNNSAFGYAALHANTTGVANTANGVYALFSNTTGYHNTANGVYALCFNTTGYLNTANGFGALFSNTTGNSNTANGYHALYSNTTGIDNTANGFNALRFNNTGSNNTANGVNALYSNTTGHYNTASGYRALYGNTIGNFNTANGFEALWANNIGHSNTANGTRALYANISGAYNTANGLNALFFNNSGSYNTASGYNALVSNKTGSNNAALGYYADVASGDLNNATAIGANAKVTASNTIQLGDNAVTKVYAGTATNATLIAGTLQITSGAINTANSPVLTIEVNNQKAGRIDVNNTFYGYQSGKNRTTGVTNTAMGSQSLDSLTTGDCNTAIGDRSLQANTTGRCNTAIGSLTLNRNTSGEYNTVIGYNALSNNITGTKNTAIGYLAGPDTGILENTTALGYNSSTTANNQVRIGNSAVTSIGGQVGWTTLSDSRVKKDIQTSVPGLAFITKLRPVTYHLNMDAIARFLKTPDNLRLKDAEAIKGMELQTGFLAQEVEKAAQELNFEFSGVDKPKNQNDLYGLRYAAFTVPLIKAVQEQQTQIEKQEQKIEQQQKINDQLQQRIEALEKLITGNSNTMVTKDDLVKSSTGNEIKVYPNPNDGMFNVVVPAGSQKMELIDMKGALIKTINVDSKTANYQLNLSGYAKGVYMLNVLVNGKTQTSKVVIQ